MQLELLSFNGNTFSPNYQAFVVYPRQLRPGAQADFLDMAGTFSQYTGKSFGGGFMTIQIVYQDALSNQHLREDEIARWFNTLDEDPYELLAQDTANGNKQWYVLATPLSIQQENNSAIILLALDEPFWSVKTASTDSWSVTTSPTTKNITCIGETAAPVITITPTLGKGSGYTYFRFVEVAPPGNKVMSNYPTNLGPLNTSTLVSGGKAQADGDDFRVKADGVEIARYFGLSTGAFNTTITNIWCALDWKPNITLTLRTAIALSGAISTLDFTRNTATQTALTNLPTTGIIKVVTAGNTEYFTYTGKDIPNYRLTGVTRQAKLSTNYAHSIGDTATWIQHDIWFVYGNSVATAPTYDDSKKPIIDLDVSTNTSWKFTLFQEVGKPRAGAWTNAILKSSLKTSSPYTGEQTAMADPATSAGLKIATTKVSGQEKSETAILAWTLNCPAGMITVSSINGYKLRYLTSWPSKVQVLKSVNGSTYSAVTSIASPTSANSWQAWSLGSTSLGGTYYYLQLKLDGTLSAGAGNYAAVEINDITVALDSNNTPVVSVKSEFNTYDLTVTLRNVTTGEAIIVTWPMQLNDTITIDCLNSRATYSDGSRINNAIELDSDRTDWLNLVNGVNQLQWDDAGTLGVTVGLSWVDKAAAA